MQTLTLTPSLTLTVAPGSDLPTRIMAIKPAKKPALARSAKRRFPTYHAGVTSTADYVRAYFGLNSQRDIAAYDNYCTDWLSLYHPLPDTPAVVSDVIETVEVAE